MAAGCLLCDLKDEAADRADGVASVPALLGAARTTQWAIALAGAAAISALIEQRTGLAISAGVLGLTTLWPRLLATEAVGPLVVDMVLTLPGVLIVARLV
jgi:4-hydroxybenzoate polyprenyltransferase